MVEKIRKEEGRKGGNLEFWKREVCHDSNTMHTEQVEWCVTSMGCVFIFSTHSTSLFHQTPHHGLFYPHFMKENIDVTFYTYSNPMKWRNKNMAKCHHGVEHVLYLK